MSEERVREAFRELIRKRPRLRLCIQRTWLGHVARVRPEGRTVDALFENSWRVTHAPSTDDDALAPMMSEYLNEPFAVERDLMIKARFVPHPERPVLLLSMHHIIGDGRSVMGWIGDLVRHLDGEPLEYKKVDPPGYTRALVPPGPFGWFLAFWRSFLGLFRKKAFRTRPIRMPRTPVDAFAPARAMPYRITAPAKELIALARSRGTTLNTLIFAACARALRRHVPDAPHGHVRSRLSMDVRNRFPEGRQPGDGNYVSSFFVDVDADRDLDSMIADIDQGTKAGIARHHDGSTILTALFNEVSTWLGRKLFSRLALGAKLADKLPPQSFHFTNLGRIDAFDRGKVRVDVVFPSLPHNDLLIAAMGFHGVLYMCVCYPEAEIGTKAVRQFLDEVDVVLNELVGTERPSRVVPMSTFDDASSTSTASEKASPESTPSAVADAGAAE